MEVQEGAVTVLSPHNGPASASQPVAIHRMDVSCHADGSSFSSQASGLRWNVLKQSAIKLVIGSCF